MYKLPDNIFITGLMGAGKDTLALALVEQAGFTRLSFADALKEELAASLDISLEELNQRKGQLRSALQELGSVRRGQDEDYWVKQWCRRRVLIEGPVVCPDMRYPNEAFFGLESGGLLLRVAVPEEERIARLRARDGRFDPSWGNHPSELYIPELPVHAEVPGNLAPEYRLSTIATVYASMLEFAEEVV